MQVVLSTIGRFHTFDLARQLHKRSALARVFTGYPMFKLRREAVPSGAIDSFPWLHAPLMYASGLPAWINREFSWQDRVWFDRHVARNLPACDVFHALSGAAVRSGQRAKRQCSLYFCDRGSSHIRHQNDILREEYALQGFTFSGVDPRVVDAEEAEYELADGITVPSRFAKDTFVAKGVTNKKIIVAPYGVELSRFRPTSNPSESEFRVLFAGTICVRKGVRYLLDAFDKLIHPRKSLTFVGGVEKRLEPYLTKFRSRSDISFLGHLPQPALIKVMAKSHVLVLPSVEEGLALVQAQAMACGCPVIATTNTGAEDLFENDFHGFIVPIRAPCAILEKLQKLADDPNLQCLMRQRSIDRVTTLGGWDQYGDLIYSAFQKCLSSRNMAA